MATLEVLDHGRVVSFGFDDLVKYHGRSSIGGVAVGFKVMERALPLLDGGRPPERSHIEIDSAFPGPGTRDAFEMVTRAVTGGRYRVDAAMAAAAAAPEAPEGRFFFRFRYRDATVDVALRPGLLSGDFAALARRPGRTATEEQRFTAMKEALAERLMRLPADEVCDAAPAPGSGPPLAEDRSVR